MNITKMIIDKIEMVTTKLAALTVLSIFPAGGFSVVQSLTGWYIDNAAFMSFVSVAIFIDHAVGSYVHWFKKKDFSWRKNRNGLFLKIGGSIAGYVLFEMFYQIVQDVNFIAIYLKILLQVATFAYPAMSAFVNISIATGGRFPSKAILNKFIKFEETADLTVFKTLPDESKNDFPDSDINADSNELQE